MTEVKRYYAFDSLRASMMMLGIVIHSAMSYSSSNDMSWPLRAGDTSSAFFFLVDFLHAFRMPVFFLIAGFFDAYLYIGKSPERMLINRFRRIFLPFIVFLVVLNPLIMYAFKYCKAAFDGEMPIAASTHFSSPWSYLPFGLFHLWFLYYLFIISMAVYLFLKLTKGLFSGTIDRLFERTFRHAGFRIAILTAISFIILVLFGTSSFETSISWIPRAGIIAYFLAFYITGWLLYRNRELVATLKTSDVIMTVTGTAAFCIKFWYGMYMNLVGLQLLNSVITCSLTLGIMGLALRFADMPNRYVTYFVNSAYWIYLFHFFIALLLPGLLDDILIPVYVKFIIVLLITATVSVASYHFLVRKTFVGVFLNGKRA